MSVRNVQKIVNYVKNKIIILYVQNVIHIHFYTKIYVRIVMISKDIRGLKQGLKIV